MTHENKGRYPKGVTGNPRGRPPKIKRTFHSTQVRRDILAATEEEFSFPIEGKLKKLPAIVWIHKQLVRKGIGGDVRCMLKTIELRRQAILEIVEERLSLLQEYLETEKFCKENSEDVTDTLLEIMREVRAMLNSEFTLH